MRSGRPLVNRMDVWMIGGLLLAAAMFAVWQRQAADGGLQAVVYVSGVPVRTVDLTAARDGSFSVEACPALTFTVTDGGIAVTASDCPDQVCVQAGWLRHNGQTAVCLPNGVLVQVQKKGRAAPDDVDIIIS